MPDPTDNPGPRGDAERWKRDALTALSLLLLSDLAAAARLWDALVPPQYRGLLLAVAIPAAVADSGTFTADATDDAKRWPANKWRDGYLVSVAGHTADIAGNTATTVAFDHAGDTTGQAYKIVDARILALPVWFDIDAQRYGLGGQGYITPAALLAALEAFRAAAMERASADVSAVYAGTLPVSQWQEQFAQALRSVALAAAALAWGGTARVTGDVLARLGDRLTFHLDRLQRFAAQVGAGDVDAETAARRAGMYPDSIITNVYNAERTQSHLDADYRFYANELDAAAEHCERQPSSPPGVMSCPEVTARGWQPIGSLPEIGDRLCKWGCRCSWQFARTVP